MKTSFGCVITQQFSCTRLGVGPYVTTPSLVPLTVVYSDAISPGMYVCSNCSHPLFSSRSKYAHSSPWPAFTETIREDSVTKMMESLTAFKVSQ